MAEPKTANVAARIQWCIKERARTVNDVFLKSN